mmetsp:Transcript_34091/g.59459  ORF Transcript_34091/g.59459 Transcript_34091/m.59459 type:complete len:104 (+) Transcript_34091:351-662(+)
MDLLEKASLTHSLLRRRSPSAIIQIDEKELQKLFPSPAKPLISLEGCPSACSSGWLGKSSADLRKFGMKAKRFQLRSPFVAIMRSPRETGHVKQALHSLGVPK